MIVGGLAFIFHAEPNSTKDIDRWIDPEAEIVRRSHLALTEFGSQELIRLPTVSARFEEAEKSGAGARGCEGVES